MIRETRKRDDLFTAVLYYAFSRFISQSRFTNLGADTQKTYRQSLLRARLTQSVSAGYVGFSAALWHIAT